MIDNDILKRWVKQPPAPPLIQYLRDSEKEAALRFINEKRKVLDVASESNVTLGIKGAYIARIDFSVEASDLSREILQGQVHDFFVTNPTLPILPIEESYFDAAVSIGPYDWLFLNVKLLTREIWRVLKIGGVFVFSVPTIRSPYCSPEARKKFKYYTVNELFAICGEDEWLLKDFRLIYQPGKIHYHIVRRFPSMLQKIITEFYPAITRYYTNRRLWDKASYIVVALQKVGK